MCVAQIIQGESIDTKKLITKKKCIQSVQRVIATERDATKMKRLITQWSRDSISYRTRPRRTAPRRDLTGHTAVLNTTLC